MRVYFDHNATTCPSAAVLAAQADAAASLWANPSSRHEAGRRARDAVEIARRRVAALIAAQPDEIVFTSSGTEANNAAVLGPLGAVCARSPASVPLRVITSPLEHPSISAPLRRLEAAGVRVDRLPVDPAGRIDPADLQAALRQGPAELVTLSLCNHEIGNLYDLAALSQVARAHGVPVHCDAVQAVGRVPVDVGRLGVDLLSLSGHKLRGPRGVGALYCRRAAFPEAGAFAWLMQGGGQERGRRAGTESTPAIVGLGQACADAQGALSVEAAAVAALRDRLERQLLAIPGAVLHGDARAGGRAPGTCNVGFAGVEGDLLMMNLDLRGVAVSTGAACSSGSAEPSPVLLALGLLPEQALQGVRFSLGAGNTEAEVDEVAALVGEIVAHIRSL